MRSSDYTKLWTLFGLVVAYFSSQVILANAEASRRRGDLEFFETVYEDKPPPKYYSESLFLEQRDEPAKCVNSTIGEASSCPSPLLTTLYGDPYIEFNPAFSSKKLWFARRLNEGVYVAGQLTPRHIKYAADSGIKSIVTIFDHEGTGEGNATYKLSTDKEEDLVKLTGMKFFRILGPDNYHDWQKEAAVERMKDVYPKVELPAIFHCERGVAVTMHILLYYAKEYQLLSKAVPKIDNERFFELGRIHGLDFAGLFFNLVRNTTEKIFGELKPPSAVSPFVSVPTWFNYWQCHPISGNWFMAGQIASDDLPVIKATFPTVLNIRQGLKHNGKPAQENSELINIESDSPTYGKDGRPLRQRKETLEGLIIDRNRSEEYVGKDSLANYESQNKDEFGDLIGYNERLERDAVKAAGIEYIHMPLSAFGLDPIIMPTTLRTATDQTRKGWSLCK